MGRTRSNFTTSTNSSSFQASNNFKSNHYKFCEKSLANNFQFRNLSSMLQYFCVVWNSKQIYNRPLFNFSVFCMFFLCKISKSVWLLPTLIFHLVPEGLADLSQKTLICIQCFDSTQKFAYVLFQFSCGIIAISFHSIKLKVMDVL